MAQKRMSPELLEQGWIAYRNEGLTLKQIAAKFGFSQNYWVLCLRKIPGYKELAKTRQAQVTFRHTYLRSHTSKYKMAMWETNDSFVENVKKAVRLKHENARFWSEVPLAEKQIIINKFKQFTTIIQIAKEHGIGKDPLQRNLKRIFGKVDYRNIIREILRKDRHLRALKKETQVAATENTGKRRGQLGNKKSKPPHQRHTFGVKWPKLN